MSNNIRAIKVGGGDALLVLSAFPNWAINYKNADANINETVILGNNEYQRIVPVIKGYLYTVTFTGGGGNTITQQISVDVTDKYYCAAKISFSYTGISNIRNDGVIELLSSGIITFNAEYNLDIFLVGGGGGAAAAKIGGGRCSGGGGGGYTKTEKNVKTSIGSLSVTIGAGGKGGVYRNDGPTAGGVTSFNTISVAGGNVSDNRSGGNGGSGGAAPAYTEEYASGYRGVDGGNGTKGSASGSYGTYGTPGTGQGTTTREFGESTGKLYADGGGAGGSTAQGTGDGGGGAGTKSGNGGNGVANTGGGGGGSSYASDGGAGGSGIVCIRLHKYS